MGGPRRIIRRRGSSRRGVGIGGPSKGRASKTKSSKKPKKKKVFLVCSMEDGSTFEVVMASSEKEVWRYLIKTQAELNDMTPEEAREFLEDRIYVEEADVTVI